NGFGAILFPGRQFVPIHHSITGVPAKKGIVISRRSNFLRDLKMAHGFAEFVIRVVTRSGAALIKFRFGSALVKDARVISALVIAFNLAQELRRLGLTDAITFAEAVGEGEEQGNHGTLVFRIRLENIEADAFSFTWFIKQTVTLGFFQSSGDGFLREGF